MTNPLWNRLSTSLGFSRRALFQRGGLLAAAQALGTGLEKTASAAPMQLGDIYRSIGVRPVINARGTFTIITGSTTLPEVKRAMEEASRSFVNMDELMDGVGKRLAELSGAEWGIVTAGCCAAITHCTASAIAGGNPERMQRLPNVTGLKNEVIVRLIRGMCTTMRCECWEQSWWWCRNPPVWKRRSTNVPRWSISWAVRATMGLSAHAS